MLISAYRCQTGYLLVSACMKPSKDDNRMYGQLETVGVIDSDLLPPDISALVTNEISDRTQAFVPRSETGELGLQQACCYTRRGIRALIRSRYG